MADFISEDKILKFKNAFSAFDKNNSGMLKPKLLGNVLRSELTGHCGQKECSGQYINWHYL